VKSLSGARHGAHPGCRKVRAAAAHTVQLLIEYDPQPPFSAGNPDKAPQPIVNAARDQFHKFSQ